MSRKILALTAAVLFVALAAQTNVNPLREYLNEPGLETFSAAMTYLAQMQAKDPTNRRVELQAAYFAGLEAKRIMETAKEKLESLNAGDKFLMGNILMALDRLPEAVEIYDQIILDNPDWSCPWRHKGEALFKMKNYKAAAKALDKAIETNKQHYDAYVWAAFNLYELKKYKQARQYLETAFSLNAEADGHHDEEIPGEKIRDLYEKLKKKTK